ncbi:MULTISPECIES: heme ABC exporter ATP-binding protein CcmA [unclassified Chelatococcus]|uniref:heme ABC exporter ATP-binding protein CcmA n=1 Tax=unclassified Chelatococcus TaxID=2638111 RepID=UPI001BCD7B69|nr:MULTISPECIES: heme ABC exporter ATP-binding protein CcmA [unclassified Chelatococcus]CAH1657881.1 Cytochrome c biogenesis ATP-binding export protein CcmA [Hyphomicrobiales bacterium]MBS7740734.1 heme ABC exporter ATP-binding protein CcmA [Chelatococcus sp. HY11]MBX3546032.1 heme ABC exporter ATP-binding protein CcmA [Chelatococcus sp.]MCO5079659.1 heme ABC exporter ATP-binding protein CcmA [Chelatococcus sp.]CAH1684302.1 Cytochrome c biogenesis ATP-binding export protein CcmA [Hyphomicrobia
MRLEIDRLSCRRSGRLLVEHLTLTVAGGEALVVRGQNGAGKSTLLATLAGRLKPASGTIRLIGDSSSTERREGEEDAPLAERAVLVGHRDGLKTALTATENLVFAAAMLGVPATPPQAVAALDDLGLVHVSDIPVGYLSAGQRRRVALARLILVDRPVWLLDEPTAALDATAQEDLAHLMQRQLARGGLIVAATHLPLGLDGARVLTLGGKSDGHDNSSGDSPSDGPGDLDAWEFSR